MGGVFWACGHTPVSPVLPLEGAGRERGSRTKGTVKAQGQVKSLGRVETRAHARGR